MKKAVFFDLDGTLIDSSPDLATSVNFMLEKIGQKPFEFELIRSWIGGGAKKLVERALNKAEIQYKDEYLEIFLEFYSNNLTNNTILFDDVIDVLEELKENYILTLITNKPYKFTIPILEHFKIKNYFEIILGAESLEFKKPHPMPLNYCLEKLTLKPKEAIMVGDTKNDIISANKAGVDSILVSYGYDKNLEEKPTFVCENLKDIIKCIK